ncbi:MAG TPA: hypothetical protein PLM07_10055 [Candidatus Rifleibacterium sp.]|nr:hypothetical protein [Candidatus Rifleibacterium sp.]HPT46231.1 hypothetical protein [Candidatus Rifleibacterium sp.]
MLNNIGTGKQGFVLVLLVALLVFCQANPATALQQLRYPTFATPWTETGKVLAAEPVLFSNTTPNTSGNGRRGLYERPNQSGTKQGDGYMQLAFPAVAKNASTTVLVLLSVREPTLAKQANKWSMTTKGTIRKSDETVIADLFSRTLIEGQQTDTWQDLTWSGTLAPAGVNERLFRIYWFIEIVANNKDQVGADFSDVYLHMSPCGLAAAEEAVDGGGVTLTWNPSAPGTGQPGFDPATAPYRIYRRTDPLAEWQLIAQWPTAPWVAPAATTYTDTTSPASETVYYCITDFDTNLYESPKSPEAVFKPARLVIDEVTSGYESVTIGQTAEVYVKLHNSGNSPIDLFALELDFEGPASAAYSVVPPTLSPAAPLTLAGGASATLTFQVTILDNLTAPGFETINASGAARATVRNLTVTDTQADDDKKERWTICWPASLEITEITVPPRVFRGQVGATIDITTLNNGGENAAGEWLNTAFKFEPGGAVDFTNLRLDPLNTLPVEISQNNTITRRYLVDVSANAQIGPCNIFGRIYYQDVNLRGDSDFWTDFDDSPVASWSVLAGIMRTFRTSSYLTATSTFNAGANNVFAKAENLQPLTSHRFRWFDPDDHEVLTSGMVQTNDLGVMTYEFPLTGAAHGRWRVVATKPLLDTPLAEAYFWVQDPAAISISLGIPPIIVENRYFNATMTMTNIGEAAVAQAYAGSILRVNSVGNASLGSLPTPTYRTISGFGTGMFSWGFTATTMGSYSLEVKGYGYDDNDGRFLETASVTSNVATITTAPVLSVTGVSETYDNVSPGQANLTVNMDIANTGGSPVYVNAASLTFDSGAVAQSYTQVYASPPVFPFVLDGNSTARIVFTVAVDASSLPGAALIRGSFTASEVYDLAWGYGVPHGGGTGNWTVADVSYGECSANQDFLPQQYTFNQNQRIYVRFHNVPDSKKNNYAVLFFDDETLGIIGDERESVYGIPANTEKTVTTNVQLPGDAAVRKWRVECWEAGTSGKPVGTEALATQYFWVEYPGQLVATLTVNVEDGVDLGEPITVTMSLANEVASSAVVYPASATTPIKFAGTGAVSPLTYPSPDTVSIQYGYPATFTWTFMTDAYSIFDTFQLTSTATGVDRNTASAPELERLYPSVTAFSKAFRIYDRKMTISPITLDFGTMIHGETKVIDGITINNTGNATMTNIQWQLLDLESPEENKLPLSAFFPLPSPEAPFTLNAPGIQTGSFTLTLPYNQASGTYEKLLWVYDDVNYDTQKNATEPAASFTVRVTASECSHLVVSPQIIDLGGWPKNITTASKTLSLFSGGNLDLTNVKFKEIASDSSLTTLNVLPATLGSMVAGSVAVAEVSASIGAEGSGPYIATWSAYDDGKYASATFQIRFSVGAKVFDATSDPVNPVPQPVAMGAGNPDNSIENVSFTIRNTLPAGELPILAPRSYCTGLQRTTSSPDHTLPPEDNIIVELPAGPIPYGETRLATLSIFIPPGTPEGDYEGVITIYDDEDGFDSTSAFDMQVTLTVNPFFAISVLDQTVDVGGISPDGFKQKTFKCMNIGSLHLASISWLMSAFSPVIPVGNYSIEVPANAAIGTLFLATVTMDLSGQAFGTYLASPSWLYNDLDGGGKSDPADAADNFGVKCQVGNFDLDIINTALVASGVPNALSDVVGFEVYNTGNLDLELPKIRAIADLTLDASNKISTTACVFTTIPIIKPHTGNYGSWAVQTPPATMDGEYVGSLKVWNDDDGDGYPGDFEASDTVAVTMKVLPNTSMIATPDPCLLPVTRPGGTATAKFHVVNTGNRVVALSSITKAALIRTSGGSIPVGNIGFTAIPANIPVAPADGYLATVTATVTVPPSQVPGTYSGIQVINYDGKQLTFVLEITVGEKKIAVTSPVLLGTSYPKDSVSASFNVTNESSTIVLDSIRWLKADFNTSGAETFSAAALTFSDEDGFGVAPSQTKAMTAFVTVPAGKPAGNYIATITAFDDQIANGAYDDGEASRTFQIHLTVGSRAVLTFVDSSLIDTGGAPAGTLSAPSVVIPIINEGNIALNNLTFLSTSLSGPGPSIAGGNVVVSGLSNPLAVGVTDADVSVCINVPAGQNSGIYSGFLSIYDSTLLATHPLASCTRKITIFVPPDASGPDIASGAIYQEIATKTFSTGDPETFIFSAFVAATGSVGIGFMETLPDESISSYEGIVFDFANLTLIKTSPAITACDAVPIEVQDGLSWYRIYMTFDYKFDENMASHTYIILKNATPDEVVAVASYSAWFDGIQLEKTVIPGQTRPTAFRSRPKLISPSDALSVDGKTHHYEW